MALISHYFVLLFTVIYYASACRDCRLADYTYTHYGKSTHTHTHAHRNTHKEDGGFAKPKVIKEKIVKVDKLAKGDRFTKPDKLIKGDKFTKPDKLIKGDKFTKPEKLIKGDKLIKNDKPSLGDKLSSLEKKDKPSLGDKLSSLEKKDKPSFGDKLSSLEKKDKPSFGEKIGKLEKPAKKGAKGKSKDNKEDEEERIPDLSTALPADLNSIYGVELVPMMTGDDKSARVAKGNNPSIEAYFKEGSFDSSFDNLIVRDANKLIGDWRLLLEASESTDDLMRALGVSGTKIALMRRFKSLVKIRVGKTSRPSVSMQTYLPANIVKDIDIYVDGKRFSISDSDAGNWNAVAVIYDSQLLQKRASTAGTMYDVRATLSRHPDSSVTDKPVHAFKWTFIDNKGKTYVAHRYFKVE